ncbi:FAD-dependent monooxygenase [Compostimonas suwonensis]|uniref:2-polyprenyl-6-methoxyphenol hydroxylase-like FAD-dependent oxidoreductase n=1 Tax=Compostimonas suwonensis TaxID=1048394 RepID=A0A2M9BBP9_9MICO|nr:FAD-dependent monooxygenase [Compostimonas suwonensis]PJJ55381.1 2-polyprenyl-6-methoxyphenol hydroxylase-like FAD-dependent oxidoreductase [Compostimonas suwonensis]
MRVAVIGAGTGGLTIAAGLGGEGHEVVVYERRVEPGAVGAGLTLFGNAFGALDAIGLGDIVREVSSDAIARMRAGQRTPSGDWLVSMPSAMVPTLRSLHRAELHRALVGALPAGSLQLGQGATVAADGQPVVRVDGAEEGFDLVIAADGLRSDARALLGLDRGVRYAGYTAWRGVTVSGVNVHGEAGETWGRGRIFGIVPLPDERVYWFATESTAAGQHADDERETVRERFGNWHPPILACIDATTATAVLRHDIYDLARIPATFVKGRTVLLGDAAHGMTPNLGQGAGQAIEDAATLTLLLRSGELDAALSRYDELRRKRTRVIWRQSRLMGKAAQASHPIGAGIRDALLRATPSAFMGRATQSIQRWTEP